MKKLLDEDKIQRTRFLKAMPPDVRLAVIAEILELLDDDTGGKKGDDLDEDIRQWAKAKEKIFNQINQRT